MDAHRRAGQNTKPTAERHVPVLLSRSIQLLEPAISAAAAAGRTPVIVDATLGMGGHTEALLSRFPELTVVGLDRDTQALELAGARLAPFGDRVHLVHTEYDGIREALDGLGMESVDGVLFDLGVSSLQLDEVDRGFAYSFDAPLDMRMDTTTGITAAELVNTASLEELRRIIRTWGEEKFAHRIAHAIVQGREKTPFATTAQLVEVIRAAVPPAAGKSGGHPAKRTFQALRIAVNEELDVLTRAMPAAINAIGVGGRIVVLSYHSLEDKIVKHAFAEGLVSSAPAGFPVELDEHKPYLKSLVKGTGKPREEEISDNPRAASAKLRAVERITERRAS